MQKSGYISKAACRGYRPRRLTSYNVRQRSRLISRLTRDRLVARFIVAPTGYGKTSLAIDYAETMFSWAHVFWLNAKSPCFIRDLDDGDIASECIAVDSDVKLVVVEDVPQLDSQRIQRLSHDIDVLLAHGCEVLITCVPSCDLVGSLQLDRLRLGAEDLLLDEEEIAGSFIGEERYGFSSQQTPAAHRVPALVWDQSPESPTCFVASCIGEDIPADLLLVTATVLLLQRGTFDDLATVGPVDRLVAKEVLADYPHLGFDFDEGSFEAPLLDAEMVAQALKGRFDSLVERSSFSSRTELACAWAEIALSEIGAADRACDAIRVLCSVRDRAQWFVQHGRKLFGNGCFFAMTRLAESLRKGQYDAKDRVRAFEAVGCWLLGNETRALELAKRCAFDATAHDDARAIGLVMAARFGKGVLHDNAVSDIEKWAASIDGRSGGTMVWHEALVLAWAMREDGADKLALTWQVLHERKVDDDVLCIVASWLYDLVKDDGHDGAFLCPAAEPVERFVRLSLACDDLGSIDFAAASAGLSMEQAHMKGMPFFGGPLPAGTLLALRRVETAMLRQRRQYEQELRRERTSQSRWPGTNASPGYLRKATEDENAMAIPLLEVKTFGRFDVSLGGAPLDLSRMRRKHTRELLVLLAANWGRDLSIDSIATAMWPSSDVIVARKNFYTTWSQLRRGLALPDGTCPYLVRSRYGCRLNDQHVKSDLARLSEICRELLLGRIDFDAWLELYNEIDRDFSGELLPIESGNRLIAKARKDYCDRLIDALTMASMRLVDAGNPQWGIWFARAALSHGPTREDVHVALMRAQIAHGQRTAAMMTYLNCRRLLADELGIDPSPESKALYESLLDG